VRSYVYLLFGRFQRCHLVNDSDTKHYLQHYKKQFTNYKMFLQTYSNLNMMLTKNYDVKQSMRKTIITLNIFF